MGAAGSKIEGDQGIITVVSDTIGKRGVGSAAAQDPLLHHLQQLQAAVPRVDAAVASAAASSAAPAAPRSAAASSAGKAADPESLLGDVELAKQLAADNKQLTSAVAALLTSYQAWHRDNTKALTTNQVYIARTIDQAEAKADKAVRHVLQQTTRLKHLAAGLSDAAALPGMLAQLTESAAALEQQLAEMEQLAAKGSADRDQQSNT